MTISGGERVVLPPCPPGAGGRTRQSPPAPCGDALQIAVHAGCGFNDATDLLAGNGVVLARFGIHMTGASGKPRPPLLNARTDGMRKCQFRTHLQKQRCVIPAEGFYEWREEGGKQPYYFSRKDGKPLILAGIWQEAEYKGDRRIAFAILTDEPNELVASYHDRMPLALADEKVAAWLDLSNETPLSENLLLDLGEFMVRPVDRAMNNVREKNLSVIDPGAEAA